mmetsp:Transcript_1879/g.2814  ORF Transcript_1879/g.2814 Transcript_1879/m.2814 type:complete len:575 (-) Transcript_1879:1927-3651(-)
MDFEKICEMGSEPSPHSLCAADFDFDDVNEEESTEMTARSSLDSATRAAAIFRSYLEDYYEFEIVEGVEPNYRINAPPGMYRKSCGLVYSPGMLLHSDPAGGHPERPARILSIRKTLELTGLDKYMVEIEARKIHDEDIIQVHSHDHPGSVRDLEDDFKRRNASRGLGAHSVYANQHTTESAYLSAGGVLELVQSICEGKIRNGIAVVRPPGHHAENDCAKGFCLFNNVAVAAAWATRRSTTSSSVNAPMTSSPANYNIEGSQNKKQKHQKSKFAKVPQPTKVLIVDWDVHHGNGTQHMFESDPNVLFFSVHRWDRGEFYPGGPDAGPTVVGVDDGIGSTINVGWNGHGPFGDPEYLAAWEHVLMPAARNFNPDLVIVSAGFDAAEGDPLGMCGVTPAGYGIMLHQLLTLANGRVAVALEGGYDLDALSQSCLVCSSVLLGNPPPRKEGGIRPPSHLGMTSIGETINAHKQAYSEIPERDLVVGNFPHVLNWVLGVQNPLPIYYHDSDQAEQAAEEEYSAASRDMRGSSAGSLAEHSMVGDYAEYTKASSLSSTTSSRKGQQVTIDDISRSFNL